MDRMSGDHEAFPAGAEWLQLPDETNRAYAAFCVYRDYGPRRSLRQTCQDFYGLAEKPPAVRSNRSPKLRQIQVWSSQWDWPDRAWAYTSHMDGLARIEALENVKAMYRTQAAVAKLAITRAAARLAAIDPNSLTASEAIKLLEVGTRIERTARAHLVEAVESVDPVVSGDRLLDEVIMGNPAAAVAARDLSLALSAAQMAGRDPTGPTGAQPV